MNAQSLSESLSALNGQPVVAFNFGQAGAGPVTNAIYARRLLSAQVRANFVVVEVHPVFLAGQRADPPEGRWLLPLRLRASEMPVVQEMGFPVVAPPAHGYRGWLAPLHEYRFLLLDRYAPALVPTPGRLNAGHEPDAWGYARVREVTPHETAILTELTRQQYADYFPGYSPTGPGVEALRDTLTVCRTAGCKVALLLTPESVAFRSWYPPEGMRELERVLAKLAHEHDAELIDARSWLPDERIGDGHHLTGSGADYFSAELGRRALVQWLAGSRKAGTP